MDESFEIRVRNHKKEAVTVRVVEHLYRWTNWKLTEQSQRVTQNGRADRRVPHNDRARRRAGGDLHRALFLVTNAGRAPVSAAFEVDPGLGCQLVPHRAKKKLATAAMCQKRRARAPAPHFFSAM